MKRSLIFVAGLTLLSFVSLIAPLSIANVGAPVAQAQTTEPTGLIPCGYGQRPECTFDDLLQLARNLINFMITLSTTIATISFAYAGYLYLTAAGDSGKIKTATGIFTNVAVGFIIVLAAWFIVNTFLGALAKDGYNKVTN